MSDYKDRLVGMLADGYSDAYCIQESYNAKTGEAVLDPMDSLAHFVVSEALATVEGKVDRPKAPLAFDVGLAMQRAASELERLARHCRRVGLDQLVIAFLRDVADSKKQTFAKADVAAWLKAHGDDDMCRMQDEFELRVWAQFPEQTKGPGPWIITRTDLLKVKVADNV